MFRHPRKTSDFNDEIESHLQLEIDTLKELGFTEEEARAAARRRFGNVTHAREQFYEGKRWLWWDHFWQDLRFGVRTVSRNPGFATVAIATLALGIAVNATMFSLVSAFLLHPPPGRDPDRVVVVTSINPAGIEQVVCGYRGRRKLPHGQLDHAKAIRVGTFGRNYAGLFQRAGSFSRGGSYLHCGGEPGGARSRGDLEPRIVGTPFRRRSVDLVARDTPQSRRLRRRGSDAGERTHDGLP